MILSRRIPFRAETFIKRCADDVLEGRFCSDLDGYRDYLLAETARRHKALLNYLTVVDTTTGRPRVAADADHIIPRSVWNILMLGLLDRTRPASANVLSNLFWRDPQWNRGNDYSAIQTVWSEAKSGALAGPDGIRWRKMWIEIFLRTKRERSSVRGRSGRSVVVGRVEGAAWRFKLVASRLRAARSP